MSLTKNIPALVASIVMVAVIGLIDHFTGIDLGFFVFYLIPVVYASWFIGRGAGIILSFVAAVAWYAADFTSGHIYPSPWYGFWNAGIRLASFIFLVYFVSKVRALLQVEKQLVGQLQKALGEVRELSGLLPICSSCKKVRDDQGYWEQIESYIQKRTKADFSHSLCPECVRKLYPDAARRREAAAPEDPGEGRDCGGGPP